jgi:hypothetical protein
MRGEPADCYRRLSTVMDWPGMAVLTGDGLVGNPV